MSKTALNESRYKRYSEYKDSGVEWLGDIPLTWNVLYGKRIFKSTRTPAFKSDEQLAASQKYGVIPQTLMMKLNGSKVMLALKGTDSFRHVDKNNYVISLRSFEGGIEHSNYEGCVSPAYTVLSNSKPISYNYYKYLLKCAPFIAALQASTDSLRDGKSISYDQFGNLELPHFDVEEQTQIANFLDHETAKIDTLIDKQQQLISLLKEKRQAVISHAVTRGLNPDAPMKDSGVEWLGEVPAHWIVVKLKHIISELESGCSVNASDIPAQENEIGVLKTSCVYTRSFRVNENKTVIREDLTRVKCPIRKDAIIISRMNTPELVGASAIVDIEKDNIYLPDRLWQTVFDSSISINSKFLSFFMMIEGFRNQISLAAEGASSSMQNIAKGDYLAINTLLPPIAEQNSVVIELERRLCKFSDLVNNADLTVTLLQERRTALISAAVTGKIDVRHFTLENGQAPISNQETAMEATA